jgi:competence/damage-inducible protein CinA-like protein
VKIAVVGIGDELLAGQTVNSNAAFICRHLFEAGFPVSEQRVVGDAPEAVQELLSELLPKCDLVICTGGLGPTLDDNTRTTVAKLFGMGLAYNEEVAQQLVAAHGPDISTLEDQATIPEGAIPLHNRVGTAPGLFFEKEGLILLPGVPLEMETLFVEQVLPHIHHRFEGAVEERQALHIFQTAEAEIDQVLREVEPEYRGHFFGIYPGQGTVTVRIGGERADEAIERVAERFPGRRYEADSLEEAVQEACVAKGLTLATAESCSGGGIAASLTARPGTSSYYVGGVVSYSNEMKEALLGVSHETLVAHGAVSQEVVEEMVQGVVARSGAHLGVAVSGIAGPTGGTPDKPVGTVWIAVMKKGKKPLSSTFVGKGGRKAVIRQTIHWALAEILKLVDVSS